MRRSRYSLLDIVFPENLVGRVRNKLLPVMVFPSPSGVESSLRNFPRSDTENQDNFLVVAGDTLKDAGVNFSELQTSERFTRAALNGTGELPPRRLPMCMPYRMSAVVNIQGRIKQAREKKCLYLGVLVVWSLNVFVWDLMRKGTLPPENVWNVWIVYNKVTVFQKIRAGKKNMKSSVKLQ